MKKIIRTSYYSIYDTDTTIHIVRNSSWFYMKVILLSILALSIIIPFALVIMKGFFDVIFVLMVIFLLVYLTTHIKKAFKDYNNLGTIEIDKRQKIFSLNSKNNRFSKLSIYITDLIDVTETSGLPFTKYQIDFVINSEGDLLKYNLGCILRINELNAVLDYLKKNEIEIVAKPK